MNSSANIQIDLRLNFYTFHILFRSFALALFHQIISPNFIAQIMKLIKTVEKFSPELEKWTKLKEKIVWRRKNKNMLFLWFLGWCSVGCLFYEFRSLFDVYSLYTYTHLHLVIRRISHVCERMFAPRICIGIGVWVWVCTATAATSRRTHTPFDVTLTAKL